MWFIHVIPMKVLYTSNVNNKIFLTVLRGCSGDGLTGVDQFAHDSETCIHIVRYINSLWDYYNICRSCKMSSEEIEDITHSQDKRSIIRAGRGWGKRRNLELKRSTQNAKCTWAQNACYRHYNYVLPIWIQRAVIKKQLELEKDQLSRKINKISATKTILFLRNITS